MGRRLWEVPDNIPKDTQPGRPGLNIQECLMISLVKEDLWSVFKHRHTFWDCAFITETTYIPAVVRFSHWLMGQWDCRVGGVASLLSDGLSPPPSGSAYLNFKEPKGPWPGWPGWAVMMVWGFPALAHHRIEITSGFFSWSKWSFLCLISFWFLCVLCAYVHIHVGSCFYFPNGRSWHGRSWALCSRQKPPNEWGWLNERRCFS